MSNETISRFEKFVGDRPQTFVFILICDFFLAWGGMAYGESKFVTKDEFSIVQAQLSDMTSKVNTIDLEIRESRLSQIEAQIYDLERLEANGQATERDLGRLDMLRSQQERLNRELDVIYGQMNQ